MALNEVPRVVTVALACSVVLSLAAGWTLWVVAAAHPSPSAMRWVEPVPAVKPMALPTESEGGIAFAGSGSLTIADGRAWGATVALAGSADACPICSRSLARDAFTSEPNIVLWDREWRDAFRGCYDCLIAAVTSARR